MLRATARRLGQGQIQARAPKAGPGEFDFVVVGGGATGMLVACRLAQENYSTLVLEQGPDIVGSRNPLHKLDREAPFAGIYNRGQGKYIDRLKGTVGGEEAVFEVPKVVGGAGVVLGPKSYQRGHQQDWAAENKHFPLKYEDHGLILYYKKLENVDEAHIHRGDRGRFVLSRGKYVARAYQPILQAFNECGMRLLHDFNNPHGWSGAGAGRLEALIDDVSGVNCSSSIQYVKYVNEFQRPLTIRGGANVQSVELNDTGVATGVTLASGETIDAARGVILAAGAIGTPQVLQRTANVQDHVQQYLQDDRLWSVPCDTMRYRTSGAVECSLAPMSNPLIAMLSRIEWMRHGRGWFAGSYDDMSCFIESSVSRQRRAATFTGDAAKMQPYPDLRITVQPFMTDAQGAILSDNGVQFKVQLVRPQARGRVSADGVITMQKNEEDEAALAEGRAFVQEVAERASPKTLLSAGLEALRTYEGPHGGTCGLDFVVDKATMKLNGTQNLHVIDGSLVPKPLVADAVPLAYAMGELAVDRTIRKAPPVM